jgi:hypothetical protein
VLFVIALACGYRIADWRGLVGVITAFTIGHSLTLALSVAGLVVMPGDVIEPLIAATIVLAGLHGIFVAPGRDGRWWFRPLLAGGFGLVHGAGFANYLRSMFVDDLAAPLLGFNVGLEIGQLAILAVSLALFVLVDGMLGRVPVRLAPSRLRGIAASVGVTVVAATWTVERVL